MPRIIVLFLALGLLAGAVHAQQHLDWMIAYVDVNPDADGARIYMLADGTGTPFAEARAPGGSLVDATITLRLTDIEDTPLVGYPAEDLFLFSSEGGVASCPGGLSADGPTGNDGTTTWTVPPEAGGHSIGETVHIWVSGWEVYLPVSLSLVSSDINGDLTVDISDVAHFVQALYGNADEHADFNNDGEVNLTEISMFTAAIGVGCP